LTFRVDELLIKDIFFRADHLLYGFLRVMHVFCGKIGSRNHEKRRGGAATALSAAGALPLAAAAPPPPAQHD